jgi:hypothetical protein
LIRKLVEHFSDCLDGKDGFFEKRVERKIRGVMVFEKMGKVLLMVFKGGVKC